MLLATTALESTWGSNQKLLFLGEWCKKFSKKKVYITRDYQTLDYHWLDRKKLKNDHKYLAELYENILVALSAHLNTIHDLDKDLRYWRIIIGPWLISYIAVIWDRWESVSSINKLDKIEIKAIKYLYKREVPMNHDHHHELIGSDLWNYSIFNDILDFIALNNFNFIESSEELCNPSLKKQKSNSSLYFRIKYFIDVILFNFQKSSYKNYFFTKTYFPKRVLYKIAFKLGFIPGFDTHFDQKINYKVSDKRYNKKLENFKAKNKFESFLTNNILNDIPSAYAEDFYFLHKKQNNFLNTKIIFTANAHLNNDLFKIWAAEQTSIGAHLVISSHGGALYPLYSIFNHQELIADTRIVWGKEWMNNQIRMPANKLNFQIKNYCKDGDITLIGYDNKRYSYRLISTPTGPLVLNSYKHSFNLISKLNEELNGVIRVRPKRQGSYWETEERYISDFGKSIISKHKSMQEVFKKSRLIICTYPETTLSESIFSGVPTILYMQPELWETQQIYEQLLINMKKVKIFHDNAESAQKHILSIYSDPIAWWISDEVKEVLEEFHTTCLTDSDDHIFDWVNFFKKL